MGKTGGNKVENIKEVENMRKHCKNTKYCIDKQEKVCKYRDDCISFLKGDKGRYTPAQCDVNELHRHFKLGLWQDTRKKKEYTYNLDMVKSDRNPIFKVWYKFFWYWERKKGFTVCEEWKDFTNFVIFYTKTVEEGYTIVVNPRTSNKIVNADSVILYRMRKLRCKNEVNMNEYEE